MEYRGRGRLFSYGLAAAVTFIWSVTFVSTKYLLTYLEPGEILLYRVALAYAVFVAASPRFMKPADSHDELRLAAAGLLMGSAVVRGLIAAQNNPKEKEM